MVVEVVVGIFVVTGDGVLVVDVCMVPEVGGDGLIVDVEVLPVE